jgi:hypothetical protein
VLNSNPSIYAGRGDGKPWAGVVVGAEFAAVGGVDVKAGDLKLSSGTKIGSVFC